MLNMWYWGGGIGGVTAFRRRVAWWFCRLDWKEEFGPDVEIDRSRVAYNGVLGAIIACQEMY